MQTAATQRKPPSAVRKLVRRFEAAVRLTEHGDTWAVSTKNYATAQREYLAARRELLAAVKAGN